MVAMLVPRRCCGALGDEATPEGGDEDIALLLVLPPRELKSSTIEERRRWGGGGGEGCSDMMAAVDGSRQAGCEYGWLYVAVSAARLLWTDGEL